MKDVLLEYASGELVVSVPDGTDVLGSGPVEPLVDVGGVVERSLAEPIGTVGLAELASGKTSAAIVVSDNTRPVPYKGAAGILRPLIKTLQQQGVGDIRVIVANGTHRSMSDEELRSMLDESAFAPGVRVINHVCTDPAMLECIGSTEITPEVMINRHYLEAELKIATGLVEPHFMAGFSGGRKAICPGIVGQNVLYGFHSVRMLDDQNSASLVLQGNRCHEESLRIARMAGVDFLVNVTVDSSKRPTGVFAGELEAAHQEAVAHCRSFATVQLARRYDVVITHSGHVGMNHYQCAKAVMEATRAVRPGGAIILLANLCDCQAVGSDNYRELTRLLARIGSDQFRDRVFSTDWVFRPDQWQVQMWAKAFADLGDPKRCYLCAPQVAHLDEAELPETNVAACWPAEPNESQPDWAARLVQQSLDSLLAEKPDASVLVLPAGPYAVPTIAPAS